MVVATNVLRRPACPHVETAEPPTLTRAIELAIRFDAGRVDAAHRTRSREDWSSVRYKGGGHSPRRDRRSGPSSSKPVEQKTRFNALEADVSDTDGDSGAEMQGEDSSSSGSGAEADLNVMKTGQSGSHKKKSHFRKNKKPPVGAQSSSASQPKNGGKPQAGK